ncbi:MAG TPA: hypothetical protein VEG08_06005 [Terriglobales bacterium]|nr:hypothetical protein [Terriglobales bacterium]
MHKRMKWFACAVALVALAGWMTPVTSAQVRGKTGKAMTDKATKSRGTGQDPNIKNKSQANDPNAKVPKTRGGGCVLELHNQTPWKVQFYADGNYEELVAPWSTSTYSFSGTYTLYARADFTDGSTLTWGPRTATCESVGWVYPWTWTE